MPKIEPAVRTLSYIVPAGTSYVDLAKDLSIVNRRLYRQGMTYVVQDISIGVEVGMTATDVVNVQIGTTGNSWIVHNAWKKGFEAWKRENRKITEHLNIQGKWADFKVYLDDSMEDGTTLSPYASDGAVYSAGEWEYSKLVFDDDGTEKELKMHMIGSSNLADTNNESGIGLIQEYADSRATVHTLTPDHESEASDTIYAKLLGTDEMSDMMVDNIETDNDSAPYDQDEYPGGSTNADAAVVSRIGSVNATQSTSILAGFAVPCGLLKFTTFEYQLDGSTPPIYEVTNAPNLAVFVTIAPGPYRGVLAAPMGQ